jgi:hypothetical protein
MVNWKKAGGILVTIGVTATILYVSYSVVFLANKKDLELLKKDCPECLLFSKLMEGDEARMEKKISNITKKQLKTLHELCLKTELTDSETKQYNSIIDKWGFKKQ